MNILLPVVESLANVAIGKVINFFMHEDLKLSFENRKIEGNTYYFFIRCKNKTSYNIKLTKIYIKESEEKALLEIGHYTYEKHVSKIKYENIKKDPLNNEHSNLCLSPIDTKEYRNYMMNDYVNGILNNEASINIKFRGIKTVLYIEYEILDIKPLFLRVVCGGICGSKRTIKIIIPI